MEKKYKENKVLLFFKKNIYAILMVVCLLAIIALVTYTVIIGNQSNSDALPAGNVVDASGKPVDDSNKENKTETDTPKTTDKSNTAAAAEADKTPEPQAVAFVIDKPIEGAEVLKDYTDSTLVYNATMKHWSTHQGVDFLSDVGTAVRAVFDGEVTAIGTTTMRGTEVTLKHSDGFSTIYALLAPSVPVKVGDKVKKGDVIGYVAQTGYFESADPSHLHFEVKRDDKLVDPNYYFEGNDNK
ncbi:MAG: M23 family metallopeptidase [Clostridia bacterium]|nr:M23 family metallopeptidase [Clostridia bacterium]